MKALKLYGVEDLRYEDNESQSLKVRMTLLLKNTSDWHMWFRHVTIQKWGHTLKVCHLVMNFQVL